MQGVLFLVSIVSIVGIVAACLALGVSRASFYRAQKPKAPAVPRPRPPRAFGDDERAEVLAMPERFGSVADARTQMAAFLGWTRRTTTPESCSSRQPMSTTVAQPGRGLARSRLALSGPVRSESRQSPQSETISSVLGSAPGSGSSAVCRRSLGSAYRRASSRRGPAESVAARKLHRPSTAARIPRPIHRYLFDLRA